MVRCDIFLRDVRSKMLDVKRQTADGKRQTGNGFEVLSTVIANLLKFHNPLTHTTYKSLLYSPTFAPAGN